MKYLVMILCAFISKVLLAATPAIVGKIDASFQAGEDGSFQYVMPIELPKGSPMTPQVTLFYNSNALKGIAGTGFNISGLSRIDRCPSSEAFDGYKKGVDFSHNDQFCLDGERLSAIHGEGGKSGTEYRTIRESFIKVVAIGQVQGGPEKFKVWRKSGEIVEYGFQPNARLTTNMGVSSWLVHKITDRSGNYMLFDYHNAEGTTDFRPKAIHYGGNEIEDVEPRRSIEFIYEERLGAEPTFAHGVQNNNSYRLKKIELTYDSKVVWFYELGYQSPTASYLTTIKRCAAPSNCSAPTRFEWNQPAASLQSAKLITADDFTGTGWDHRAKRLVTDVDNDGYNDLVGFNRDASYIAFGTQEGFEPAQLWSDDFKASRDAWSSLSGHPIYVIDINGDSFKDVVAFGSKGVFVAINLDGRNLGKLAHVSSMTGKGWSPNLPRFLGDFNGDGTPDIIAFSGEGVTVLTGKGDGFIDSPGVVLDDYNFRNGWYYQKMPIYVADVNQDGFSDIIGFHYDGVWVSLSNGTTFEEKKIWLKAFGTTQGWRHKYPRQLIDFNGDGYLDIVGFGPTGVHVAFGTGYGFTEPEELSNDFPRSWFYTHGPRDIVDINGDGLLDLVGWKGKFHVFFNTGMHFTEPQSLTDDFSLQSSWNIKYQPVHFSDFNNDGTLDLVGFSQKGIYGAASESSKKVLKSIIDGFDKKITPRFGTTTDRDIYTPAEAAAFPLQAYNAPIAVLASVMISDGTGGQRQLSYHYKGAKAHVKGFGFLGFEERHIKDHNTNQLTINKYNQDTARMLQGTLHSTKTYLLEGEHMHLLSSTLNLWQAKTIVGSTPRFILNNQKVIAKSYDLGGELLATVTTTQEIDDYGNIILVETQTKSPDHPTHSTKTANQYEHDDPTRWLLGRLSLGKVINTTEGTPSIIRQTRFDYLPNGLLKSSTREPGTVFETTTSYAYNARGQVIEETLSWPQSAGSGLGFAETKTSYTYVSGLLQKQVNAKGHVTIFDMNPIFNAPDATTDPNDQITHQSYNPFGQPISRTIAAGSSQALKSTMTYSWCDKTCPENAVYYVKVLSPGKPGFYEYRDMFERTIRKKTINFNGQTVYQDTSYNQNGQIKANSKPYFAGDLPVWTHYEYGPLLRQTAQIYADGSRARAVYRGLSVDSYDRENNKTTQIRNPLGQTVKIIDHLGSKTVYKYNPTGSITEITDPKGNTIVTEYDILGRKIAMDDPDSGRMSWSYNPLDSVSESIDAMGLRTTHSYDELGREIKRTEAAGTSKEKHYHWSYDTTNAIGFLGSESVDHFNKTYQYDKFTRLASTTAVIRGTSYTIAQDYDKYHRLQKTIYPTGFSTEHQYDDFGFLTSIVDGVSHKPYWTAKSYYPTGDAEEFLLGNGIVTRHTIDPLTDYLTAIKSTKNAHVIQDLEYEFSANGNLLRRSDAAGAFESFEYDHLNRLIAVTPSFGKATSIQYDEIGNIISRSDIGYYSYQTQACNGVTAGPHAVSQITGKKAGVFCYDPKGNLIKGHGRRIDYSPFNKPTKIIKSGVTTDLYYDAHHSRFEKIVTSDNFRQVTTYVSGLYEKVQEPGKTTHKHYIHGIAVVSFTDQDPAQTHYLHQDHLGSIVKITDAQGKVVETMSYDPWGKRRDPGSFVSIETHKPEITTRSFTSHEALDEVGLIHMNGRVYDPTIGRFLSPDPFVQDPLNLASLNRYSYVWNNPLSYTDPSGYFLKKLGRAIGGLAQGISNLLGGVTQPLRKQLKKANTWFNENRQTIATLAISTALNVFIPGSGNIYYAMAIGAATNFISSGGDPQAALRGAVTAGLFYGVGTAFEGATGFVAGVGKVAAHGMVGGVVSVSQGGDFQSGFLSSAVSQSFSALGVYDSIGISDNPTGWMDYAYNAVAAGIVGGTVSELSGGSFENGAITAAYGRLFNDLSHTAKAEIISSFTAGGAAIGGVGVAAGCTVSTAGVGVAGCSTAGYAAGVAVGAAGGAAAAAVYIFGYETTEDLYDYWMAEEGVKTASFPAPGIPTAEDGFKPPKKWDGKTRVRVPGGKAKGFPAKDGSIWVPTGVGPTAHGGPHWDVQHPDGSYTNRYPGGRKRKSKR